MSEIVQALADDLNTWGALTGLDQLANHAMGTELASNLDFLGILSFDEIEKRVAELNTKSEGLDTLSQTLAAARAEAMETKDFSRVDILKQALVAAGVEVRMSKAGVELIPGPDFDPAKLEGLS